MNKTVLVLSIVLNLALAGVVGVLWSQRSAGLSEMDSGRTEAAVSAAGEPSVPKPAVTTELAAPSAAGQQFDWRAVESEDYKKYIANLRAIGCPEETIRDIIRADVNKLFESRARAERGGTNKFEYWKSGNPLGNLFNEKSVAQQQALAREKRELLKELLGADAADKPDLTAAMANPFETILDFLPAEKQTKLIELEQQFAAKMMNASKDAVRGDRTAMTKLQAEKDAELLAVLTPEEKFEYDLRMSQSAMVMRMQLGDFELSEPEFRDIFKLRKQLDDQFGVMGMGATTKTEQQKRDAAQAEMNAQIKELLGARYTEYKYEAGGEWAAQMLHRIAKENNVPRDSALKAYEITDLARAEAAKVKANAALGDAQRQAALQAMHTETAKAVTEVLGAEAAQSYLKKVALIPGVSQTAGN
jgi:hypothetical protein